VSAVRATSSLFAFTMSNADYYNQNKGNYPPPGANGQYGGGYYPQQPQQAYHQGGYPQQGGYAPQPQPQVVYVQQQKESDSGCLGCLAALLCCCCLGEVCC